MIVIIKKVKSLLICFFYSLFCKTEKKFVILICSYNNQKYCKENICSVVKQKYRNFRVIFVNDNSSDETLKLSRTVFKKTKINFKILNNKKRKGSTKNKFDIINRYCKNDEIIVVLDGDDILLHNYVLGFLNYIYQSKYVWMTFGSYIHFSGKLSYQIPYSKEIIEKNNFRKNFHPSHLRSFYAWLFKKIPKKYLMKNQKSFFMTCEDKAIMYPLIELSGKHHKFINQVLYYYNDRNPNNLYNNIKKEKEKKINLKKIKSMKPLKPLSKIC